MGQTDASAFGEELRHLRLQAGLTQEALAERSGISTNAIAALENGRRRRPRPITVAMLAAVLAPDADDRRRLEAAGRGEPHPQPPGVCRPPEPRTGIPPGLIAHFVGREAELAELGTLLRGQGRTVVHGLGGVGKTQLAVRYLHARGTDYTDGVFWLRADQESSLVGDLAGLAWRLRLPEWEERHQDRQIEAVLRWLRDHGRWILVLDNLEPATEEVARRWLPPDLPGHLLATSRSPLWSSRLLLEPLSPELASRFLLLRTGQLDGDAARLVADRLGCLPLALEQAAAYLEVSGRDLASYAELLETRLLDLMAEGTPAEYPRPVARTWHLSFERMAGESGAAQDLLRLCAVLAPDDVPISVLTAGAEQLPTELRRALVDPVDLDRTIAALRRYSLVERHGDGLRVHRLVQAVVRESMPADQRRSWLATAVRLLAAQFPEESEWHPERWPLCDRLLPHVEVTSRLVGDAILEPSALTALLIRLATYLQARGDLRRARPNSERALAVREQVLGREHPAVAQGLNDLAVLLLEQGEMAAARALHERALDIRERQLGPDHADVVNSLSNLGMVLRDQGDLAAARPLLARALAIRERRLPADDPKIALSLNNLALVLAELGEVEAARPLQERALRINERSLGCDHPRTSITLRNLGNLLRDQGELAAAGPLLERALAIEERALGTDHPQTANSLASLGLLRRRQGDTAAARRLLERCLDIRERLLGPDHPRTAWALHDLALVLHEQGELDAARAAMRRAAATSEQALGPEHPTTIEYRRVLREVGFGVLPAAAPDVRTAPTAANARASAPHHASGQGCRATIEPAERPARDSGGSGG